VYGTAADDRTFVQAPAGVALSPDGTRLAVAVAGHQASLRVYATASGEVLRNWTAQAAGRITAEDTVAGSGPDTATTDPAVTLRWSPGFLRPRARARSRRGGTRYRFRRGLPAAAAARAGEPAQ
jgi:hypothetical protein